MADETQTGKDPEQQAQAAAAGSKAAEAEDEEAEGEEDEEAEGGSLSPEAITATLRAIPENRAISAIDNVLGRLVATARASTVFGQPVQHGDTMVIPCAEVAIGMGMGMGFGGEIEAEADETETDGGGGGGGGGGARGRPVAAVVITPGSVHVQPIIDPTRIALALLTTLGFIVFWLARLQRATGKATHGEPSFEQLQAAVEKG